MKSKVLIVIACVVGLSFSLKFLLEAAFFGAAIALQQNLQSKLNSQSSKREDYIRAARLADESSLDGKMRQFETFMNSGQMDNRRVVSLKLDLSGSDEMAELLPKSDDPNGADDFGLPARLATQECSLMKQTVASACIVAATESRVGKTSAGKAVEHVTMKLIFKEKTEAGPIPHARNSFYLEKVEETARVGNILDLAQARVAAYHKVAKKCETLRKHSNCSILGVSFDLRIDREGQYLLKVTSEIGQIVTIR